MYISFWIPLAVLAVALAIRLPGIIKLWQDPLLRAVGGLLLLACAVFVFAAPDTIAWTNRVTGVPNISAPVVYTLLTAFCGSCLLLVIAWRNGLSEHSPRTRRATRWVLALYTGVIVALWALFALADVPDERVRDLDTYYARTAFMREEILLYLLAHTAACLVTSRVIWNWIRTGGLGPWLRGGLRFMGVGYAMNLLYDGAKLSAVLARWTGHDLDWLSTDLAPPVACVSAVLIAVGFVLPHTGQYLQRRTRTRLSHWRLRPLYRLMRTVTDGRVAFKLRAAPELRLTRRETFIRDELLHLARYLDEDLRRRAHDAALGQGFGERDARLLAHVVTVQDAVDTRRKCRADAAARSLGSPDVEDLLEEIEAVSRTLRRTADIRAVRDRASAVPAHVPAS
ncbi:MULTISPECIES: MAB_1171c family putative transporter [unclassified Streptomyces]|uniref:MAB_1171c family putative transporter n=1 Tax=unclassified Streptomyces TaxID=2593676 RepID=UPI0033A7A304